jgi:hypothetical protein
VWVPDGHISDKKSLTLTYLPHGKRESRKADPIYSLALNNLHVFLECPAGLYIAYSLHLIPTRFINLDIAHSWCQKVRIIRYSAPALVTFSHSRCNHFELHCIACWWFKVQLLPDSPNHTASVSSVISCGLLDG